MATSVIEAGKRWRDPRFLLPDQEVNWPYVQSLEQPRVLSVHHFAKPWENEPQWHAAAGWNGTLGYGEGKTRRAAMQDALWHVFLYQVIGQHIPCGEVPSFYLHLEKHPISFV